MIRFTENEALAGRHTFGLNVFSRYFLETDNLTDLFHFSIKNHEIFSESLILGEGSNLLFTENYPGLILHASNKDISVFHENDQEAVIQCGSGYNWDLFVDWTVNKGLGGLENLSGIPGSVGAAPVQNIGAYGVEAKDCISEVHIVDLKSNTNRWIKPDECNFAYRNSIFKNPINKLLLVWEVRFKLSKEPKLNQQYRGIAEALKEIPNPDIRTLRDTVISVRSQKLPDPDIIGNAGSFFKNPIISDVQAAEIKKLFPDLPIFQSDKKGYSKLAAGWLIEQAGMKGVRRGDAGTYKNQALVIVNYGKASGAQLNELAQEIQDKVLEKFKIQLDPEVRII